MNFLDTKRLSKWLSRNFFHFNFFLFSSLFQFPTQRATFCCKLPKIHLLGFWTPPPPPWHPQGINWQVDLSFLYISEHWILTDKDEKFVYKKLCICTGGRPNIISKSPFVVGIRDTESVQQLKDKLSKARRVVIVGNGGIALELVWVFFGVYLVFRWLFLFLVPNISSCF